MNILNFKFYSMPSVNEREPNVLEIGKPNLVMGEYPSWFENEGDLKTIKANFEKLWLFEDHPSIDWVEIWKVDLSKLPSEILGIIDNIKWKTLSVFDFCLVKTGNNIGLHGHLDWVWEVYFEWDGWVEVAMSNDWYNICHLKKWSYATVWEWVEHWVKKIDDKPSTFFAVKFEKEAE